LGASPDPSAPSIADFICDNIGDAVDWALDTQMIVSVVARIPGEGQFSGGSAVVSASGPIPNFNVDAGGDVEIVSFTTSPSDPAPFQGYTAFAEIRCAAPGTRVTLSIIGTDGYSDSITHIVTGDQTVSLFVPGAEESIVDRVTVTIDGGPSRQVVLVF
jgi:hypothetical protein